MKRRAPAANLEIVLKGVFPEDVAPRDLYEIVEAVQSLVGLGIDEDTERPAVRLLDIRRGSARYLCKVSEPDSGLRRLRALGIDVDKEKLREEHIEGLSALEDLSRLAKRLQIQLVLKSADNGDGILATIGPETYQNVSRGLLASGEVTLPGQIEKVGGATAPRCLLRLPTQTRAVVCSLDSRSLAKQLGPYVYSSVVAKGRATWIRGSQRIIRFRIASFRPQPTGPVSEGFAALRRVSDGAWDKIGDPRRYLLEQTGE